MEQVFPIVPAAPRAVYFLMPGYGAGWFGLANGEKALVYRTPRDRVVYVPTREGCALLLSVDAPDAFLAALGAR